MDIVVAMCICVSSALRLSSKIPSINVRQVLEQYHVPVRMLNPAIVSILAPSAITNGTGGGTIHVQNGEVRAAPTPYASATSSTSAIPTSTSPDPITITTDANSASHAYGYGNGSITQAVIHAAAAATRAIQQPSISMSS